MLLNANTLTHKLKKQVAYNKLSCSRAIGLSAKNSKPAITHISTRHVLNQRIVPKEAEDECADEDGKQQNQNFSESIRSVLGLDKILNHL